MVKEIVINGKVYAAKPITFNTICQFEDLGVPMSEIEQKSVMLLRAYAAICMEKKVEQAGGEIEKHVLNGGTLDEIANTLNQAIGESGFFQALSKRAETADSESKRQET